MPRKRTSLSKSIADLAATITEPAPATGPGPGDHSDHEMVLNTNTVEPTIPVSVPVIRAEVTINPEGELVSTILPPPSPLETPESLFRSWSRTPEGRRVTDTRIPTDPIRLGSILDDNARLAFLAGYAAANPGFE